MAANLTQQVLQVLETLTSKMDGVSQKLNEVALTTAILNQDVQRMAKTVDETQITLRGDKGVSGLVARVEKLEANDADCEVGEMREILLGTKTTPGLVSRMVSIEKTENNDDCEIGEMREILLGTKTTPGLVSRMVSIEKTEASLRFWGAMVAGVILADVVMRLWSVIVK